MRNLAQQLAHLLLAAAWLVIVPAGCTMYPARNLETDLRFDGARALALVEQQLAFGPRIPGTHGHARAGDWIVQQLDEMGWQTEVQTFDVQGLVGRNLIARAPGSGPAILLGAHYDTRARADRDPFAPVAPVPGANDGASGVAVLLELARALPPGSLPYPLWLGFFDAEDGGGLDGRDWILGSTRFAETMEMAPAAVVIVDMVGDADLQLYLEGNSDPALAAEIWAVAARLGYSAFVPEVRHTILDDHIPFVLRGIPAVDMIDFDYPAWHTTRDTLDQVSADSLAQVGRTLEAWLHSRR
jgi:glutaminyl-peptide cyclotransferase